MKVASGLIGGAAALRQEPGQGARGTVEPDELARLFEAELLACGIPVDDGDADFDRRLAAVVARGRDAHPALALDDATFVRLLARAAADVGPVSIAAVESLAVEDLYLASACVHGRPGAIEAFQRRCGPRIQAVLRSTARAHDLRVEADARARDVLFVAGADGTPRLASYKGQGPLDRWVAVVVHRVVIALLRADQREQRARASAALRSPSDAADLEQAYVRQRYRADFENALRGALQALEARDRVLLRLQLVGGVGVGAIGRMYGVSQSTASRWLAQAREQVSVEVERILHEHLNVSHSELVSLADLVASQLDISMSRLLRLP